MFDDESGGFKKSSVDTKPKAVELADTVFCTIKMINDSKKGSTDDYEFSAIKLKNVIIIGRAYNRVAETLRDTLVINDNTGTILAMAYKPQEESSHNILFGYEHKDGAYVRIYGKIVSMKEKQGIVINFIKSITSNEITYHYLKVASGYIMRKNPNVTFTSKPTVGKSAEIKVSAEVDVAMSKQILEFAKTQKEPFRFEDMYDVIERSNDKASYEEVHAATIKMVECGALKESNGEDVPLFRLAD